MLNTKIEHFRNLVSLAAADGKIAEVEMVALSKIAYENGIPLDRLNVMIERANEYVFLIPQNQEDKDKQMSDMIKLAMLDGEFANAERELINLVGSRLGFSPKEIRDKIDSLAKKV
ncbi:MAG TPA: hypothetical protein PKL31_11365 [Fulvivirga sp.]|nr:hypothetical protein [Fulvivirga sp.]